MLSELQPLGLSAAARRLDLDPFELIRAMVATDGVPAELSFTSEALDALAGKVGIEASWWTGLELPDDDNPARRRVRAALGLLVGKGCVGDSTTRMDNLWRGLAYDDQQLLGRMVAALVEEGAVVLTADRLGTRLALVASEVDKVRAIAEGKSSSPALDALYEG